MLFTSRPLAGHFEPLVPLAVQARAAGHAVAFATGEPYASRARQAGFDAFRAGRDEGFRAEWAPRFPGFDQLVGDAQRHFFLTEIFANLELVPRAEDLESIVDTWRPQLIVHEVAEFAAPLVGTARGIPYVDVSYGSLISSSLLRATGEAAGRHWQARGLEPHPVAGLFRHLYVDTCPPSLQSPEIASIAAVQLLRPAAAEIPDAVPPDWLDQLGSAAVVYLTMGTVWNRNLDVFRMVIEAVRDDDIALIVTIGRQNDPASLGPQPDNVLVHQYTRKVCCCHVATPSSPTVARERLSGLWPLAFRCWSSPRAPTSTPTPSESSPPARDGSSSGMSCRSALFATPCAPYSAMRATVVPPNASRQRSTTCRTRVMRSDGSKRSPRKPIRRSARSS